MYDAMWILAIATVAMLGICGYLLVRILLEEQRADHADALRLLKQQEINLLTAPPLMIVLRETNWLSGDVYYRPLNATAKRHLPKRRKVWRLHELLRMEWARMARVDII